MTKIGFLDKFLQKIIFSGTFLQTKYLLMKINVVKIKKSATWRTVLKLHDVS